MSNNLCHTVIAMTKGNSIFSGQAQEDEDAY